MQKLFTASQIRAWDNYTIKHEPISSIHLMERAAIAFKNWFVPNFNPIQKVHIFCGPGNNGGDGFAICRLLVQKGYQVTPYLINSTNKLSDDCQLNYQKLAHVKNISENSHFTQNTINENDIIIDAIFGSGLSRPIKGIYKYFINTLNSINCKKIAVDIPSGMYFESQNLISDTILKVDTVATFQTAKYSFYFKENQFHFKNIVILDIKLSKTYYTNTKSNWCTIDELSEITEYNNYSKDNILKLINPKYNTLESIQNCLNIANTQQKIIRFKALFTYIITPKSNIYILSH